MPPFLGNPIGYGDMYVLELMEIHPFALIYKKTIHFISLHLVYTANGSNYV